LTSNIVDQNATLRNLDLNMLCNLYFNINSNVQKEQKNSLKKKLLVVLKQSNIVVAK